MTISKAAQMARWDHLTMGSGSQQRVPGTRASEALLRIARLAALVALISTVWHQAQPHTHAVRLATVILLVGAGLGWVGWLVGRSRQLGDPVVWISLAVLGACGGAVAVFAPIGFAFPAVAALGAGIAFEVRPAAAVAAVGALSIATAVLAFGPHPHLDSQPVFIAEGTLSVVAGLMAGNSRRQYLGRALQAEELLAEQVRADAERDKATALAERNRVGREIHDVLAHSLGALSVQLDAADALMENGDDPSRARQLVQQARLLAVQGLEETRQAVHALRDEPVALAEQLASLAAHDRAELVVTGSPRPLAAAAGLALYRAAQEAVTNARKHAPSAAVSIALDFAPGSTRLVVTNGPGDGEAGTGGLGDSGGGFGLRGMRERIELLGGEVSAGPMDGGWTVAVAVPA